MNTFYQIYGAAYPPGSGGIFQATPERFATQEMATKAYYEFAAKDEVKVGSGIYPTEQFSFWVQRLTEKEDGSLVMEFL